MKDQTKFIFGKNTDYVHVTVSPGVKQKLRQLAYSLCIPYTRYIRYILETHVEDNDNFTKKIPYPYQKYWEEKRKKAAQEMMKHRGSNKNTKRGKK